MSYPEQLLNYKNKTKQNQIAAGKKNDKKGEMKQGFIMYTTNIYRSIIYETQY